MAKNKIYIEPRATGGFGAKHDGGKRAMRERPAASNAMGPRVRVRAFIGHACGFSPGQHHL